MLIINTTANLNSGLSIGTGLAMTLIPDVESAYPNEAGTGMVLPVFIKSYKDQATLEGNVFETVVPIKDGSESIGDRSLLRQEIEYTNAEWGSPTGVNRDTMEDKMIPVLEAWNAPWNGNISKA